MKKLFNQRKDTKQSLAEEVNNAAIDSANDAANATASAATGAASSAASGAAAAAAAATSSAAAAVASGSEPPSVPSKSKTPSLVSLQFFFFFFFFFKGAINEKKRNRVDRLFTKSIFHTYNSLIYFSRQKRKNHHHKCRPPKTRNLHQCKSTQKKKKKFKKI
jgi:hypothetical protein